MIWMWCLSEGGEDNLGPACTNEGLVLGRTPLIERRDRRFVVRDRAEIEALLSRPRSSNDFGEPYMIKSMPEPSFPSCEIQEKEDANSDISMPILLS